MSLNKNELDDINNTLFLRSLTKRVRKLYMTKSGKPRRKLNNKDLYQRDILESCLRINAVLKALSQSRTFLDERKDIVNDSSFEINNADFIRYHMESFFLRTTTFKDIILKLINRTCNYGLRENIGLERNLLKITKSKNQKDIIKLLDGLDILIKHVAPIRNSIAHGGYHDDIDLILIESDQSNPKERTMDDDYSQSLKRLMFKIPVEMYSIELMASACVLLFYKTLLPIRRSIEKEMVAGNINYKRPS